jgi:glycosyltransferase involved in cell wall biosynthesis
VEVTFVCLDDGKGMYHYALNLASAMSAIVPSSLVLFSDSNKFGVSSKDLPVLILKNPENNLQGKIKEKYNPTYYRNNAKKVIEQFRPRLIHITSDIIGILSLAKTISESDIKVLYTVHDPLPHEENTTRWHKIVQAYRTRFQMPRLINILDAVHVHSERHKQILTSSFGDGISDKIYVIPHGGGITPSVRDGQRVPPELLALKGGEEYVVLFFGQIHPYKGLECLIEAITILRAKQISLKLLIAGEGHLEADKYRHLGNDCVVINRFIDDSEISAIVKAAGVVVLPYVSATQSGVIPLAYAFRKPVICSKVGALDEMVVDGETGMLVPPADADSLAAAILELRDKSKRNEMGRKGERFLEDRISWRKVAERHHQKYQTLVTRS